jgi:hypothetical protein
MGKVGNALNVLIGKPERKRPLGRPGHRWKDEHGVVNTVMNLRVL